MDDSLSSRMVGPYVEELATCYASQAFAISNEHFGDLSA
jgi:hypothetical protein